jgi:flavin reductase (DIM6/NTAB) family NADH-FMN oxidoreductase RutF
VALPQEASPETAALRKSTASVDPKLFRQVMGLFATGIAVITTKVEGRTHGMTANAFMAGSLDPPLCVISVGKTTRLHEALQRSGRYGVSFLRAEQQHLSNHFAGRGITDVEPEFTSLEDIPVLTQALALISADVIDTADCGDHTLFIGLILRMEASPTNPLLYYRGRYSRLEEIAGRSQVDPPMFW